MYCYWPINKKKQQTTFNHMFKASWKDLLNSYSKLHLLSCISNVFWTKTTKNNLLHLLVLCLNRVLLFVSHFLFIWFLWGKILYLSLMPVSVNINYLWHLEFYTCSSPMWIHKKVYTLPLHSNAVVAVHGGKTTLYVYMWPFLKIDL